MGSTPPNENQISAQSTSVRNDSPSSQIIVITPNQLKKLGLSTQIQSVIQTQGQSKQMESVNVPESNQEHSLRILNFSLNSSQASNSAQVNEIQNPTTNVENTSGLRTEIKNKLYHLFNTNANNNGPFVLNSSAAQNIFRKINYVAKSGTSNESKMQVLNYRLPSTVSINSQQYETTSNAMINVTNNQPDQNIPITSTIQYNTNLIAAEKDKPFVVDNSDSCMKIPQEESNRIPMRNMKAKLLPTDVAKTAPVKLEIVSNEVVNFSAAEIQNILNRNAPSKVITQPVVQQQSTSNIIINKTAYLQKSDSSHQSLNTDDAEKPFKEKLYETFHVTDNTSIEKKSDNLEEEHLESDGSEKSVVENSNIDTVTDFKISYSNTKKDQYRFLARKNVRVFHEANIKIVNPVDRKQSESKDQYSYSQVKGEDKAPDIQNESVGKTESIQHCQVRDLPILNATEENSSLNRHEGTDENINGTAPANDNIKLETLEKNQAQEVSSPKSLLEETTIHENTSCEDTEKGDVIESTINTEISDVNEDTVNTEISDANEDRVNTEIADVNEDTINTEISDVNKDTVNKEISDVNEDTVNTEISDVNEDTVNTEISDVNEDTVNTEISDVNEDTVNTEISDVNEDIVNTVIGDANEDTVNTEISDVNEDIFDTEISEGNEDTVNTEISDSFTLLNLQNKGIESENNDSSIEEKDRSVELSQKQEDIVSEIKSDHIGQNKEDPDSDFDRDLHLQKEKDTQIQISRLRQDRKRKIKVPINTLIKNRQRRLKTFRRRNLSATDSSLGGEKGIRLQSFRTAPKQKLTKSAVTQIAKKRSTLEGSFKNPIDPTTPKEKHFKAKVIKITLNPSSTEKTSEEEKSANADLYVHSKTSGRRRKYVNYKTLSGLGKYDSESTEEEDTPLKKRVPRSDFKSLTANINKSTESKKRGHPRKIIVGGNESEEQDEFTENQAEEKSTSKNTTLAAQNRSQEPSENIEENGKTLVEWEGNKNLEEKPTSENTLIENKLEEFSKRKLDDVQREQPKQIVTESESKEEGENPEEDKPNTGNLKNLELEERPTSESTLIEDNPSEYSGNPLDEQQSEIIEEELPEKSSESSPTANNLKDHLENRLKRKRSDRVKEELLEKSTSESNTLTKDGFEEYPVSFFEKKQRARTKKITVKSSENEELTEKSTSKSIFSEKKYQKSPLKKKGRGRPKKIATIKSESVEEKLESTFTENKLKDSASPLEKKRRGRPKKIAAKSESVEEELTDKSIFESTFSENPESPLKKRQRGRPRKIITKTETVEEELTDKSTFESSFTSNRLGEDPVSSLEKRRIRRPRNVITKSESVEEALTDKSTVERLGEDTVIHLEKKQKGHTRKGVTRSESVEEELTDKSVLERLEEYPPSPWKKKRRGRPITNTTKSDESVVEVLTKKSASLTEDYSLKSSEKKKRQKKIKQGEFNRQELKQEKAERRYSDRIFAAKLEIISPIIPSSTKIKAEHSSTPIEKNLKRQHQTRTSAIKTDPVIPKKPKNISPARTESKNKLEKESKLGKRKRKEHAKLCNSLIETESSISESEITEDRLQRRSNRFPAKSRCTDSELDSPEKEKEKSPKRLKLRFSVIETESLTSESEVTEDRVKRISSRISTRSHRSHSELLSPKKKKRQSPKKFKVSVIETDSSSESEVTEKQLSSRICAITDSELVSPKKNKGQSLNKSKKSIETELTSEGEPTENRLLRHSNRKNFPKKNKLLSSKRLKSSVTEIESATKGKENTLHRRSSRFSTHTDTELVIPKKNKGKSQESELKLKDSVTKTKLTTDSKITESKAQRRSGRVFTNSKIVSPKKAKVESPKKSKKVIPSSEKNIIKKSTPVENRRSLRSSDCVVVEDKINLKTSRCNKKSASTMDTSKNNSSSSSEKKRKGRPRKHQDEANGKLNTTADETDMIAGPVDMLNTKSNSEQKRKGRPRKTKEESSDEDKIDEKNLNQTENESKPGRARSKRAFQTQKDEEKNIPPKKKRLEDNDLVKITEITVSEDDTTSEADLIISSTDPLETESSSSTSIVKAEETTIEGNNLNTRDTVDNVFTKQKRRGRPKTAEKIKKEDNKNLQNSEIEAEVTNIESKSLETEEEETASDSVVESEPKTEKKGKGNKCNLEGESLEISNTESVVTCAVCKVTLEGSQWVIHNEENHNNLAWRVNDAPLDLNDSTLVEKILTDLCNNTKFLRCELCKCQLETPAKYLEHKQNCTQSSEGDTKLSLTNVLDSIFSNIPAPKRTSEEFFASSIAKKGSAVEAESENVEEILPPLGSNDIRCAICSDVMAKGQWALHKQRKHNNLAWKVGDKPLDLNDRALVVRILTDLYKSKKPLYCEVCGTYKKSVLGYLSHKSQCQKSETEINAMKVTCELCGRSMLPVSLQRHIALTHSIVPEPSFIVPETITDDSVPQGKRRAASKAVGIIHNFARDSLKEGGSNAKFGKYVKNVNFRSVEAAIYKFSEDIQKQSYAECVFDGCDYRTSEHEELFYHLENCDKNSEINYTCNYCFATFAIRRNVQNHIKACHTNNDNSSLILEYSSDNEFRSDSEDEDNDFEDGFVSDSEIPKSTITASDEAEFLDVDSLGGNQSQKLQTPRKPAAQRFPFLSKKSKSLNSTYIPAYFWMEKFCQENYKLQNVFPEIFPKREDWTQLDPMQVLNYLPKLRYSVDTARIKVNNIINPINYDYEWKKYKLFESEIIPEDGSSILFCGGPINAMSWAPTPYRELKCDQILAISVAPDPDEKYNTNAVHKGPGLIQFWNIGKLQNKEIPTDQPKLEFTIAHDYGIVWAMEWCPSGYYDIFVTDDMKKLGLLAVASSDFFVYIYSVAYPEELSGSVFKIGPTFKLQLESFTDLDVGEIDYYSTRLSWTKAVGHQFLAVGYSNGVVGVYDLKTQASLLRKEDGGVIILEPIQKFRAHIDAITAICLHYLNNGKRWLLTGSLDRDCKLWDLENISEPVHCWKKFVITDAVWLVHWLCSVYSYDHGCISGAVPTSLNQPRDFYASCTTFMPSNSRVTSISASDWGNLFIQANDCGEIICGFPDQLMQSYDSDKKRTMRKFRCLASYTGIVDKSVPTCDRVKLENAKMETLRRQNLKSAASKSSKNKNVQSPDVNCEPRTYCEVEKKYGLIFCDLNMDYKLKEPTAELDKILQSNHYFSVSKPDMYPLQSITKISLNPNKNSFLYYACGYQVGIVRISGLRFLRPGPD